MMMATFASRVHSAPAPVAGDPAAPYRHQLRQSVQQDALVGAHQPHDNAIVLSWENVLVPIQWMTRELGFRPTVPHILRLAQQMQQSPQLCNALHAVGERIVQLLAVATSLGPVFVVTDNKLATMECMCHNLFPAVAAAFRTASASGRLQIVASERKAATTMGRSLWRMSALQHIVTDRVYGGGYAAQQRLRSAATGTFGVVCVSATESDAAVARRTVDVAPFALVKSLLLPMTRFGHALSLDDFYAQLETVALFVMEAVAFPGPLEVRPN